MIKATIREDFPLLKQKMNGERLVYLDNAATSQKPQEVIECISQYYCQQHTNVHRGVYTLAHETTERYERSREIVRRFIHAASTKEVLFTRGTTTGLNWVAQGFARKILSPGDEIWITVAEHHSNIVPWQQVAKQTGALLKFLPLTPTAEIDLAATQQLLSSKTKIVSVAQATNVLGTVCNLSELSKLVHAVDAFLVVDGAQAIPHMPVDVQALQCDFYAFSGHKMLGPTGIGVLYGKQALLEMMDPVEFGGEMIDFVYEQDSTWNELPWKFEAGTPPISEAIALGKAIEYLEKIGMSAIQEHERALMSYVLPAMQEMDGIRILGSAHHSHRSGIISFTMDDIHPHDVATALDMQGIAVRAGHHCAQPLMRHLQVPATVRASFYLYNTMEEATFFLEALQKVKEFFLNGSSV